MAGLNPSSGRESQKLHLVDLRPVTLSLFFSVFFLGALPAIRTSLFFFLERSSVVEISRFSCRERAISVEVEDEEKSPGTLLRIKGWVDGSKGRGDCEETKTQLLYSNGQGTSTTTFGSGAAVGEKLLERALWSSA